MPSLVAFGRRWNIASDDFVFPELTEGFIRLAWTGFALAVFVYHYPLNCSLQDFSVPVIILLVINVVTLCLAFSTAGFSARGTIMITRPRRHVSTLLYIRLPILVLELIWTIYSTVAVFESYIDHKNSSMPLVAGLYENFTADSCQFSTVIKVTVILEWLLFFCAILGIIVVFHPKSDEDVEDIALISRRVWSRRFRLFKIRQDELMRAALDDLANLFASFFHTSDIVFSDVVAGLLLVVHSPANEYPPMVPLEAERPPWMTEENALHYLHFAASVYGWPTFLFNNFGCGSCFRLGKRLHFCGKLNCGQKLVRGRLERSQEDWETRLEIVENSANGQKVLIVEDNCCFCHTAALILENEERNVDLFYVSFRNRLYEVPFAVLADHLKKSIVVTIRGSCSLSDLITDLCLKEEVLSEDVDADPILRQDPNLDPRDGGEVRVHKGMLQSARYIYRTLQNNKTIEDMFMLNPDYQLVVCGHSLGAGVASLLTLFLKQKYPNVQCYAFAPPGCVVSQEGIAEMEKHCMSVVSGDDVVSRISFQAMYRVREKVELELRACQRAKYEILLRGVFRLFWKTPWEEDPLSGSRTTLEPSSDRSELIVTNSQSVEYGSSQQSLRRSSDDRIQLFAPGRILYVGMEDEQAIKKWIDPRCLSDIKLSTSALTDHLPKNVLRILKAAIAADSEISEPVEEPHLDISIA